MVERIRDILVNSNLFVAIAVWSLVKLTGLLHDIDVDFFAVFSLVSTLLVYSFSIIFSSVKHNVINSLMNTDVLMTQKIVFLLSLLSLPYFIVELKIAVVLLLIPVAIVSFMYPVQIVNELDKSIALREFPYLKIFMIGISWGIVTVILPLLQAGLNISIATIIETIVRAMFVIAVTIPFDVRDVDSDSPEMKTLPQSFGVKKAKILSYFLLAINFGFYLFHALDFLSLILLFLTLLISSILVGYSGSNRPKYYYTILLESCSILLFASVYM